MVKKGADVNVVGKNGLTPLHVASHYNHSPMVTLLLTSKASPHNTAKVTINPNNSLLCFTLKDFKTGHEPKILLLVTFELLCLSLYKLFSYLL